jgi:hypothetical protein
MSEKERNHHLLWLLLVLVLRWGAVALVLVVAEGTALVLISAMAVYEDVPARRVFDRCIS